MIDIRHEIEWIRWAHEVTMENMISQGNDYDCLCGWTVYPTMFSTMWRERNPLGLLTFARVGMLGEE